MPERSLRERADALLAMHQPGNPVILPQALVARIDELEGDTGARHLIETGGAEIVDIELGEAARIDVDTPDALAAAGGVAAE